LIGNRSSAAVLYSAKLDYKGDDGLTKGGVLDADESSMERKSSVRQC
jgi:hypothetical protein